MQQSIMQYYHRYPRQLHTFFWWHHASMDGFNFSRSSTRAAFSSASACSCICFSASFSRMRACMAARRLARNCLRSSGSPASP